MKSAHAKYLAAVVLSVFLVCSFFGCPEDGGDQAYLIEYAAHGDYVYDDGAGTLTLELTVSSFPKCGGFAKGGYVFSVDSLDETTMILDQGTADEMVWARTAGDPASVVGDWAYHDLVEKATYAVILRADGSVTITSTDLDCAG